MATIADLNVRLGADATNMISSLNKAAREFRKKSREMAELADNMFAAVTLPVLGLGAAALKSTADIEKLTNAMASTMGSAEAAGREIELLREAAKAPGLDFEQAIKGSVRLQAVGISAEDSRRALSAFGNALALAGGSASDLDGVALALGQIAAKGKVSAEEINQLAERVPQIRAAMKDAFGTADTEQLQKMGISSEKFISEIIKSFEKLPKATGGLTESVNNFQSSMKIAFATLGQSINKAIDFEGKLKMLANAVDAVATWFSKLAPETQKFIVYTGIAAASIGPLAKAMAAFNGIAAFMATNLKSLVSAKTFVILKLAEAQKAFVALNTVMKVSIIGAVAAAIAGLALAIQHFAGQTTAAERATKSMADAQVKAQQSIVEEEMRIDSLIAKIKDENTARADKQAAIKELQSISPEIFGNLTKETDLTKALTDGKKKYIEALMLQAEADALYNTIVEKKQKLLALGLNSEEAQLSTMQKVVSYLTYGSEGTKKMAYEQALMEQNTKGARQALEEELSVLQQRLQVVAKNQEATIGTPAAPGIGGGNAGGENPEAKRARGVADVLAELEKSYENAAIKARLYGEESSINAEKSKLLESAISEMLELGISPTSSELQLLADRYRLLNGGITELPTAMEGVTSMSAPVLETVTQISESVKTASDYFGTFGDSMKEAGLAGANAMVELAASGETSFKKLGKAALKSAAQVIRAKIMSGVAAVVEDVMQKSGIASLVLAPLAGAAAGMIFNTALKALKIPALAKGGLAFGPQLAMVGDNPGAATDPEVIAPLSKLQGIMGRRQEITGTVRVSGSDMLILLENAERNQRRYGT